MSLPEHLRPWAQAGVTHVFLPGGLPAAAAPAPAAASAPDPATGPDAAAAPSSAAALPLADPEQSAAAPVWPAPWSTVAARLRVPPSVIITYEELAVDLGGKPDAARRKLFQSVLGYLAWPQGTCLFWPLFHAPGVDPGPVFATDVFAAGVQHFAIRHVICFGAKAQSRAVTLFPQDDGQPAVRIHAAPAPSELLGLLPHELHRALAHLKDIPLP